jgi:hypothetical protein
MQRSVVIEVPGPGSGAVAVRFANGYLITSDLIALIYATSLKCNNSLSSIQRDYLIIIILQKFCSDLLGLILKMHIYFSF